MKDDVKKSDLIYSQPFSGTKARYIKVSVLSGLYCCLMPYLCFVAVKYLILGDLSALSLKAIVYVLLALLVYVPFSYRMMCRVDGISSKGSKWAEQKVEVTLVQPKQHARFGS